MDYLTDWHPSQGFRDLREQMDRFFEKMPYDKMLQFQPSIDVFERGESVVLQAEIPGIDPKNIEINVSEDMVNIRGKMEKNSEINEEHFHRVERRSGSFNRTISLPTRVDHKQAQARTSNGILEITIPRLEQEKNRTTRLKLDEV